MRPPVVEAPVAEVLDDVAADEVLVPGSVVEAGVEWFESSPVAAEDGIPGGAVPEEAEAVI